ncbi:multiple epidermal growth factor-like domains protein 10 [Anopheles funestus]|uniref:multiple epidermal growth factor-like domains protein 10 n=1 Tax=Anopheles funestus TaxID=62324 RepID=UPI0020C61F17|nr:multiple epidermal growth factor-like domains protein 10 [Anopheles funestus]
MGKKLKLQAGILLLLVLLVVPASTEEILPYLISKSDLSIDSLCVGVNAGIFPHPDPSLCHVFITCTVGKPTTYQCAGEFIFDPNSFSCIHGDRNQCATRIEPDWDIFCTNVSYAFYEHPTMCSEFLFCSHGEVKRYSCPIGEIWSQEDGACQPGNWDTCELLHIESACQGHPDGVQAYPTDCTRYLQCDQEQTTVIDCPRGEVFEEQAGQCVAGNTETCVRIDSICQDASNGTMLKHPNECDLFISCQEGSANAHQCPTGEIFNVQAKFCAPGNPDTCHIYPLESMCRNAPSGTVYPRPDDCTQFVLCNGGEPAAMKCPIGQILHAPTRSCRPGNTNTCELTGSLCQDQPDGLVIAHPNLCEIFITCQGGAVRIQSCPNQEILRPDTQSCVPGNSLTCEFEPVERMCIGQMNSVNFPHPTDCSMFVMCNLQNALTQTCPAGSIYSALTRSCVPGNESTCEQFDTICTGRPDGIIPHPTKCTAFIYCSSGRPIFEQCAQGTVYQQGLSGCVVGNTETCTHATNICTDQPDGTTLDHPNECNLIVMCMMQQPAVMYCPAGEIFNTRTKFCTPGDAETCQMHPVETMCANKPHGSAYPHPHNCTQLVHCNSGQAIVSACPDGHVLHPGSGSCRPGNTNTCELIENVCQNQPDGLILKHPSHCGHFIWCQKGSMSVQSCPSGEILLPEAQLCLPGDANKCEYHPIDQMCLNKADYTRFPHPAECSKFVSCQGQKVAVESCPIGSIYHASTRSCVPGHEATCERFDRLCVGRPDEIIPHPLVCTAYIHCASKVAVFEQCAQGTIFDREQRGCIVGNTKSCVKDNDLCANQPDGTIIGHPNECDLYIMCLAHRPAPLRCPDGEIFNAEAQLCVPGKILEDSCQFDSIEEMCANMKDNTIYPHPNDCTQFVKCNGSKAIVNDCPAGEILHGLSKSCQPGNTKTCKFFDRVCQNQPDGAVFEHPSLCGQFIECRNGGETVHSCPEGEILRPDDKRCAPGNTSTCELEPIDQICIGKPNDRQYRHPTDCQQYVRCQDSQPVVENCRPGTIFQATSQSCVAGNGNTCSFLDGTCAGRPDGVLPHPQGCDLFLICTSGITSALRCPEGEILHPEFLVCATGNADDCTLAPVTTEAPIVSVCKGRPDGNYTHPMLCHLYIQCTNGDTEILSCPSDQIFVGVIRNCAPGNQGTCIPL